MRLCEEISEVWRKGGACWKVRERDFLWTGKEIVYEAISGRMCIFISPALTSAFSPVACVHLLTRSITTRQTLSSSLCVAFKEWHGIFLFCFQKHMPMALRVTFQPTSQIGGFPLPSSGRAEHVYQEEKWLLSRLSDSGLWPGAHFVMAGEVHLCPTQVLPQKGQAPSVHTNKCYFWTRAWGWRMFA